MIGKISFSRRREGFLGRGRGADFEKKFQLPFAASRKHM